MTQRSQGSQAGVRSSRVNASTAVPRTPAAAVARPSQLGEPGPGCRDVAGKSDIAPTPIKAAIAGARATM